MSTVREKILETYLTNNRLLDFDKRVHAAARLYLWAGLPEAQKILEEVKDAMTGGGDYRQSLTSVGASTGQSQDLSDINASQLRLPYFRKYPELKRTNLILLRSLYLKNLYGIDCRKDIFTVIPEDVIRQMRADIINDLPALVALSTYAVNFLYVLDRFVFEDEASLDLPLLADLINKHFKLNNPLEAQLTVYFYTHCVIGETLFYYRPIPAAKLNGYQSFLSQLENKLQIHYDKLTLDAKIEYLLCNRICKVTTKYEETIIRDAEKNFKPELGYIEDPMKPEKAGFNKSEHRNILFALTSLPCRF